MAVTKFGPLTRTTKTPQTEFRVDGGRFVRIFKLTKLAGDTTYTLDTGFKLATTAQVVDNTFTAISAATATPNTAAAGSLDLAVLGGGTEVFVIAEGYKHA